MSSSVTANRRTRATSHSPSTPAAARAGSGRCQSSSTRAERYSFVRRMFVWRRLWTSTRPLSMCTYGHVRDWRHRAAVSTLFTAVCAQSDISAPSPVTECTSPANPFAALGRVQAAWCVDPVLSARCVGAAARAGTRVSRRGPTHLGLPQGELFGVRQRTALSRSAVATQSLQKQRSRTLPPQRTQSRIRNFALDLPLVA
jgi:hypothetical protein